MPRKGQRLSRTTNRYSYNVRSKKRNDTYKFFKNGIRNSYRNTTSKRSSSSRKSRSKGTNIKINLTEKQLVLLLKFFVILYVCIAIIVLL